MGKGDVVRDKAGSDEAETILMWDPAYIRIENMQATLDWRVCLCWLF